MQKFTPYFLTLSENQKRGAVESIIFSAEEPLKIELLFEILFEKDELDKIEIKAGRIEKPFEHKEFASYVFDNFSWSESHIKDIIASINRELEVENRAIRIVDYAGGYTFTTKPEYGVYVAKLINTKNRKRLSPASLEVLSIIAYKQPISKSAVEEIRGVNSNELVNTLLEKNLIRISGRSKGIGKALLYSTTDDFLKLFALNSLNELPKLKEIEEIASTLKDEEPDNQIVIDIDSDEEEDKDLE